MNCALIGIDGGTMSINHILLTLILGTIAMGCTNDLKFSKDKNSGSVVNPPGTCATASASFVAPPSLVELGQVLSLTNTDGEVTWSIQTPDGDVTTLKGNSVSYTVAQVGHHIGKMETVNSCGTIQVLDFLFDAFLPVGASSIIINGGEQYVSAANVSLSLLSIGATEMYITEVAGCSAGGSWEAYNVQKLRTLQNKNQTVNVYAKFRNPAGNVSACVSDSIVHDDINPNVAISTAPSVMNNSSIANFGITATDAGSGVDTYFCTIDSSRVTVCGALVNYPSLADGVHVFSTRVSDKAGNVSAWVQHTWTIDTVKPSLHFISTPTNPSLVSNVSFGFDGSDVGSGLDGYECQLDAGNFSSCVSPNALTVTDGSHTFSVRNKDKVGNVSDPISYTWVTDATAPTVQITSAPNAFSNSSVANFTMTATDNGSGIDSYFCSLDSGAVTVCSAQVTYTALAEGNHVFSVRVSDRLGNLSAWAQHTWNVDTVSPSLRFTSTPSNPSKLLNVSFGFDGSDLGSGLDGYECKLDSAAFASCVSPKAVTVTEGSHTFSVRNKDKAGNVSAPISYTWVTDATAPVIQITASPLNPTTDKDALFRFTVTDAGVGVDTVKCSLDSAALADCVSPISYLALALGSHTFKVAATDKVGNSSQALYTWTIEQRVIDQPVVIPPGIGSADILFVMDNTSSMYGEYDNSIDLQMRNFLSRIGPDFQIGVITGDDRRSGSPYSGGQLVPLENIFPYEHILTANTENVATNFVETLARKEVTCVQGTWTGPNGRFCGRSGWNLPSSSQLISATLQALDEPANQGLFREEMPLHIVMVSDGNEVCSSGMYAGNGTCLPEDTEHVGESVIQKVQAKWPEKTLKVHSLVWTAANSCANSGGSARGTTYERLSQLTGGVSRSICNRNVSEGNAIADAIKGATSYTITLQCNPIDSNHDGVVNASDVVATYNPQPTSLPTMTLTGDRLQLNPAPSAGTTVNLRYTCP